MTKDENRTATLRMLISGFVFRHSFDIRHSSFVIYTASLGALRQPRDDISFIRASFLHHLVPLRLEFGPGFPFRKPVAIRHLITDFEEKP
jgi:hypothetical protein